VSKLVETISDQREIIRNEGLLLLTALTRANSEIQKIVAFEGAFTVLLEIVEREGYWDGGIIVCDCVQLIANLVHNNMSNKHFFREVSGIQKLATFFRLDPSAQIAGPKANFFKLSLGVVADLVTGEDPGIGTNQGLMVAYRVLGNILDLAFSSATEV
jgi:hypothetical protein